MVWHLPKTQLHVHDHLMKVKWRVINLGDETECTDKFKNCDILDIFEIEREIEIKIMIEREGKSAVLLFICLYLESITWIYYWYVSVFSIIIASYPHRRIIPTSILLPLKTHSWILLHPSSLLGHRSLTVFCLGLSFQAPSSCTLSSLCLSRDPFSTYFLGVLFFSFLVGSMLGPTWWSLMLVSGVRDKSTPIVSFWSHLQHSGGVFSPTSRCYWSCLASEITDLY